MLFNRLLNSAGGGKGGSGPLDVGKSRARREDSSKVRFDNVAGCIEEKEEMKEVYFGVYVKDFVLFDGDGGE